MNRSWRLVGGVMCLFAAWIGSLAWSADRDIFDYEGQRKAPDDVVKIVFIGDAGTHGPRGNHEFVAGSILLSRRLHEAYSNVHCVVHTTKNWPTDIAHADAVVVALNHGQRAATDPNIFAVVRKGAGFGALHFGVEVNKGEAGNNYLQWMGGYFETQWSVNPWWQPKFEKFPDHPVARGVKPFSVRDEWYYHMRFVGDMKGVTPILTDVPPLSTVRKETSDRGGNEAVYTEVEAKKPQHMAWVYERPDGGRGFGFTGLHQHSNLGDDNFRKVLLNGVAWIAKLEIPTDGVPSKAVDKAELEKVMDDAQEAIKSGK